MYLSYRHYSWNFLITLWLQNIFLIIPYYNTISRFSRTEEEEEEEEEGRRGEKEQLGERQEGRVCFQMIHWRVAF